MFDRRGLTLMEVILGLAIFVGSLAIISKLVHLGVRATFYAKLHSHAVVLAESKMGEIVAGITTLDNVGVETFEEDPAWQWQLATLEGPVDGLTWVSVTVSPAPSGQLAEYAGEIQYTLSRWVFDAESVAASTEEAAQESEGAGAGTSEGAGGAP